MGKGGGSALELPPRLLGQGWFLCFVPLKCECWNSVAFLSTAWCKIISAGSIFDVFIQWGVYLSSKSRQSHGPVMSWRLDVLRCPKVWKIRNKGYEGRSNICPQLLRTISRQVEPVLWWCNLPPHCLVSSSMHTGGYGISWLWSEALLLCTLPRGHKD